MSQASDNPLRIVPRLDASESLQQLASELAVEGIASPRPRSRPAWVEQFTAIIRTRPCASNQSNDYPDARYYVDRAIPQDGSLSSGPLAPQVDTLPGVEQCLTATNLAELAGNTHLLSPGTVVQVFALYPRSGSKQFVFNQPTPDTAVVEITGAAAGGGKYNGRLVTGVSGAAASGNLAMPEGMSVAGTDNALVLNEEEDQESGHRLAIGAYAVGRIVGTSAGLTIVMIRGAPGSTSGPTTLAGSGVSADSTSWSRVSNGTPVTASIQTRTLWDSVGGVLYAYLRNFTFDARGVLVSISGEAQVTVDIPTECE